MALRLKHIWSFSWRLGKQLYPFLKLSSDMSSSHANPVLWHSAWQWIFSVIRAIFSVYLGRGIFVWFYYSTSVKMLIYPRWCWTKVRPERRKEVHQVPSFTVYFAFQYHHARGCSSSHSFCNALQKRVGPSYDCRLVVPTTCCSISSFFKL